MVSPRVAGFGLFLFIGFLLFAAGLFLIGDRRMLFRDSFDIYTEFSQLSGLQNGANVRVAGRDSGEVVEIKVPATPSAKFRIKVRVTEDMHPLIRRDSVATIQTDGLVGNKFLQIDSGTEQATIAPPGSTIPSREPFEFVDLLNQASGTINTLNQTIISLRDDLEKTIDTTSKTIQNANQLITDAGTDIKGITASSNEIARDLRTIISNARAGRGTVGKLIQDDQLYETATAIAQDAKVAIENVRATTENARKALSSFEGQRQNLTTELRLTLDRAGEVTSDMAEATEALKRNWFFRGFFKKRGYYDLDDLTVDEYRKGVLQTKGRASQREWIHTREMFELSDGHEVLSDVGKKRIDAVMAEFLRYPRDSIIIVEGYSGASTRDQQFLRSRSRAVTTRQYLISTYFLKPELVGFMAMGAVKSDSRAKETWEGVSLVLFYDKEEK